MVLPGRGQCGHDVPIALSCKGAGRAHRAAAGVWWRAVHLTDHVAPSLPARQWVLAVPKRLRYVPEREAELQGAALVPPPRIHRHRHFGVLA
jgi:hypothetical protein